MEEHTRQLHDAGDEESSNRSDNPHFATVPERRLSRRRLIAGGLGAAVAGVFAATGMPIRASAQVPASLPPQAKARPPFGLNPTLGFEAIPVTRSDTATVPHGYSVQALIPWGTPLTGTYPEYDPAGMNSGEEQEQQVGSHHDGM